MLMIIYVGDRKPTVDHPYATLCCCTPAAGFFSSDWLMESHSDSSGPGETAVVLEKTAVVLEELLLFWNSKALTAYIFGVFLEKPGTSFELIVRLI